MSISISAIGIAAVALYLIAVAAATGGAAAAKRRKQKGWHFSAWLFLVALFLVMIIFRLFELEAGLSEMLRKDLRSTAGYSSRRSIQGPLVAGLAIVAGLGGFIFARKMATVRGRRNIAAMVALLGGIGLIVLAALRIISLHLVDRLLYGPLKINWFADVGLTCIVIGAAICYIRIVRKTR